MGRGACLVLLWLLLALPGRADLEAELSELAGASPDRQLSYLFVRSRDGQILASRDPDRLLVPASTLKVLGAAVILEHLGPQGRLATRVRATGPLEQGVLRGSLVLEGGWDPELRRADLEELAGRLRALGVERVTGGLGLDAGRDTPFLGPGWSWEDAPYPYTPALSALMVDKGLLHVRVEPTTPGSPVRVYSEVGGLIARARTADAGGELGWLRRPGIAGTELTGLASEPAQLEVTDPTPAETAGAAFREALKSAGVRVEGPTLPMEAAGEVLALHESRPVGEMLREGLAHSDNLVLESLYRRAGGGTPSELDPGSLRMVDGCGLSRYNLVSARLLVQVLRARPDVRRLLARPGQPGTLEHRFPGVGPCLVAKTGTMATISGLAGVLFPEEERETVFAILVNGHLGPLVEVKALEDRLVERAVQRMLGAYP